MKKNEFIANELCLSYRRNDKLTKIFFKDIRSSENLERAFREIWNINEIDIRESFYAIYLNHSLDVVGYYRIGDGGIDSVAIDIKLILKCALLSNATSIAVAHNHPSGVLRPSEADNLITKRIEKACELFDIRLIDHLILTNNDYYSFSNNGNL